MMCQQCEVRFELRPEDSAFYSKLKVPPPTFCPDCRLKRRMRQYINILSKRIYKRKCAATGKDIYTMYPDPSPFPVYDREYWYTDAWDAMSYGKAYDFSVPFFKQFDTLRRQVPRFSTWNIQSENCEYCVTISHSRDSYMSAGGECVSSLYSIGVKTRTCVDCWCNIDTELCYEGFFSTKCYQCHYATYSSNCRDSWFLYDCSNCTDCFGCFGLNNKQYYILNQPHSPEEYKKKVQEILRSRKSVEEFQTQWKKFQLTQPHRFANNYNTENTTGNDASYTKNCFNCFEIFEAENCKYIALAGAGLMDSYDCYDVSTKSSLCYESIACVSCTNLVGCIWVTNSHDVLYSDLCDNVSNVFGCVGLRNKQYCILNQQYTQAEYEKLLPKILEHMREQPYVDASGLTYAWGEFIPAELSLFNYNDCVVQDYFPLTAEQAQSQSIMWRADELKTPPATLQAEDMPSDIMQVEKSITQEVIRCLHAGTCNDGCLRVYKILPQELAFYITQHIPLPQLCPQCRHAQRTRQKNPLHLWTRQCMCEGTGIKNHPHGQTPCENRFETTYAPDRPEIIWCEECYRERD